MCKRLVQLLPELVLPGADPFLEREFMVSQLAYPAFLPRRLILLLFSPVSFILHMSTKLLVTLTSSDGQAKLKSTFPKHRTLKLNLKLPTGPLLVQTIHVSIGLHSDSDQENHYL